LSYNGKVSVGVAADEGLMPDGEALLEGFEEELTHLVRLVESGDIEEAPLVLHDTYQEMRCTALTREGDQCKKRAVPGSEYCGIHGQGSQKDEHPPQGSTDTGESTLQAHVDLDTDSGRCQSLTRSGNQCKKRAIPNSEYCSTHRPAVPERETRDLAEILKELSGR